MSKTFTALLLACLSKGDDLFARSFVYRRRNQLSAGEPTIVQVGMTAHQHWCPLNTTFSRNSVAEKGPFFRRTAVLRPINCNTCLVEEVTFNAPLGWEVAKGSSDAIDPAGKLNSSQPVLVCAHPIFNKVTNRLTRTALSQSCSGDGLLHVIKEFAFSEERIWGNIRLVRFAKNAKCLFSCTGDNQQKAVAKNSINVRKLHVQLSNQRIDCVTASSRVLNLAQKFHDQLEWIARGGSHTYLCGKRFFSPIAMFDGNNCDRLLINSSASTEVARFFRSSKIDQHNYRTVDVEAFCKPGYRTVV